MTRIREPDLEPPPDAGRAAYEGDWADADGPAECLRALVADSGTDEPFGLAGAVTALFTRALRFDAADPHWPDRDRIVLPSGGQTEALLFAALMLTGHAGVANGLGTITATSLHDHPAAEAVSGPAGQVLGVGVGLALAERLLAARFGRSLVDHRTWVFASAADLGSGISHEAACLAGHLGLGRLAVLWEEDDSAPSTSAGTELKRFAACGWTTRRVDGRDPGQLAAALAVAERSRKPTVIACGRGAGAPATTSGDRSAWDVAASRGAGARRGWKKRANRHALRGEFERVTAGRLPDDWTTAVAAARKAAGSTGEAGRRTVAALASTVPELAGHAAGWLAGLAPVGPDRFNGQLVCHGAKPHALAACLAGTALHGGLLPVACAALGDADALRPALRLLAAAQQRAVLLLDDDGTAPDQVAALRTVPGLHVHRPADRAETAECWELALRRTNGPSAIVLSGREAPAAVRGDAAARPSANLSARGGYVLAEANGPRRATLIASGTEVPLALGARAELAAEGIPVAVVSVPCHELFAQLPENETAPVLGDVLRVGVDNADAPGAERWLGPDGLLVAGAREPLTPGTVAQAVRKRLPIEEEKIA